MHRWRKVIYRIIVYGLIGLVANVLVAWGFAAWGTESVSWSVSGGPPNPPLNWSIRHAMLADHPWYREGAGATGLLWVCEVGDPSGPSDPAAPVDAPLRAEWPAHVTRRGNADTITHEAAWFGWPRLALAWHEIYDSRGAGQVVAAGWSIDLPGQSPFAFSSTPRRLPLEPVWRGLVLNTGLYTGVVGVVVELVLCARRVRRRGHGHCPKCSYDLCGNLAAGCPECGWNKTASQAI